MKKLLALSLVILCFVSCAGPKGEIGPTGPDGPAGPDLPGLYFIRIFQQGVYSGTYSGQVQTSLFDGMSDAYYTNASNPVNLGYNNVGGVFRPVIKFDLSSLPSSKIIVDKAELTVKSNSDSFGGGASAVTLHKVINTWTVFQAGWDNKATGTAWSSPGGDFDSRTMTAAASYNLPADSTLTITLDPTVVQDWMLNPSTNYGMLMKVSNESSVNYAEIYSSGAAEASNRPMLKVWYYTTE
jgi:hypothetical protein